MEFTEEKKKDIEKQIVDICIGALDNKTLDEKQMGDVSFFVLERIDLVKTEGELIDFLKKLTDRWPIFKGLYEIEKGQEEVATEKKQVENVEALIKDGNIDQALEAAKTAMTTDTKGEEALESAK